MSAPFDRIEDALADPRWRDDVDGDWLEDQIRRAIVDYDTTENGQANICTHQSATGVDTAPVGPEKVWRCDHCGLTWKQEARP